MGIPRIVLATVVAAFVSCPVLITALSTDAKAGKSPQIQCRAAVANGLSKWLERSFRARHRCALRVLDGSIPPSINCLFGNNSDSLKRKLDAATAALESTIVRGCASADWALLSFPGPCEEDPAGFGAESMSRCIQSLGGAALSRLLSLWYPPELGASQGEVAVCVGRLPRKAAAMVVGDVSARLRCLLSIEDGSDSGDTDCLAAVVPYGPGTGTAELDRVVLRAYRRWLSGMPRACFDVGIANLGYGQNCSPSLRPGLEEVGFVGCVLAVHQSAVPGILDLAFPSDPVCGNGILQEGEECDLGTQNSDTTANACRRDCTLPICGDATTDPARGEQCDDGNAADLDGCTVSCVREFCGDSIVNNAATETCDDGNLISSDRCTGQCREAVCGDGVRCSDASCTTGPGGGVEQCDDGVANAKDARCAPDCSGFPRTCTLTLSVSNAVNLGALTYELSYGQAAGEFLGVGAKVECSSLVAGGLFSFFDNEAARTIKESVIQSNGFTGPIDIARCNFATTPTPPTAQNFSLVVIAASTPDFDPATAMLAISKIECQ